MSSYQNYCMSPFRWNIEKNNRFYMLQDNKCVLNCLYFYIRTYTDVFYMYCISFRFNVYVYISIPIYVLSWLWILVLIAVFFVSNLMYCFFMLCQKWRNKQVIYLKRKMCMIILQFHSSLFFGSVDGLEPNKCQAMIWTHDVRHQWIEFIHASICLNKRNAPFVFNVSDTLFRPNL